MRLVAREVSPQPIVPERTGRELRVTQMTGGRPPLISNVRNQETLCHI